MTDIDRIVRMLRVSESDPVQQEAAAALEAQAKEIKTCQQTELTYVTRVADAQREYSEMQAKLKARIAELKAALKPFADVATRYDGEPPNRQVIVMLSDLRNARAKLKGEKG